MNPKIKEKWVAALRGGEYKQCKEALKRDNDGFCCLGVLCDIHAKETGCEWKPTLYDGSPSYDGDTAFLPEIVRDWAELSSRFGDRVKINNETTFLSDHNDAGVTFDELADAIENQL